MSDFEVGEDARDFLFRGRNREIVIIDMFSYTCRYFKNSSDRFTLPEYAMDWKRNAVVVQDHRLLDQVMKSGRVLLETVLSFFRRNVRPVISVEVHDIEEKYEGAIPIDTDGGLDKAMSAEIISLGRTLSYRNAIGGLVEVIPDSNDRFWPPRGGWKTYRKYLLI